MKPNITLTIPYLKEYIGFMYERKTIGAIKYIDMQTTAAESNFLMAAFSIFKNFRMITPIVSEINPIKRNRAFFLRFSNTSA